MGGGLSPALPALIQIPGFFSHSLSCGVKSLPYNFNFLQGLIPWSVVAQALNPFAQSLDRRAAAAPALAGLTTLLLPVPPLHPTSTLQLTGI